MGSLQATRWEFFFLAKLARTQIGSKSSLPEATRMQDFPQNFYLMKAIPFATLQLFLFLDSSVTINHQRIMLSTTTNYFSALKKKHYDDLTDYDKGKLHGIFSAYAYSFAFFTTFQLYGVYKGMR